MDVFKYLISIYSSKDSIYNHITVFSLLGILTISIICYAAYLFGNFLGDFLGFAPVNHVELFINLFILIMLICYFVGYNFQYVNSMFNEKSSLIEPSLSAYMTFVKTLPLIIVWGLYFVALLFIGLFLFPISNVSFHLFFTILLCLIPFIFLILVSFAKDFKYRSDLFNPFILLWVLDKTLGAIIFLTCKVVILSILPVLFVYLLFHYSAFPSNVFLKLGFRIAASCIALYLITMLGYIYSMGLVKISKEKLAKL